MLGITAAVPLLNRISQLVEAIGQFGGGSIPTEELSRKVSKLQEVVESQAVDLDEQDKVKVVEEVADGMTDVLDLMYKLLDQVQKGEVGGDMDEPESASTSQDATSTQAEASEEEGEWDGDEALVEGMLHIARSKLSKCNTLGISIF